MQALLISQDYCQDVDCSMQLTPMGMLTQNLSDNCFSSIFDDM